MERCIVVESADGTCYRHDRPVVMAPVDIRVDEPGCFVHSSSDNGSSNVRIVDITRRPVDRVTQSPSMSAVDTAMSKDKASALVRSRSPFCSGGKK